MRMLVRTSLVFAFVGAALSGCATIGHDARNQAVLVQSDPPGAQISLDGKPVGVAPMYVLVPRKAHPHLTLSRDGVEKNVDVKTNYRWGSFFSNLVFYVGAPVGWALDLVTGSAWNPQDTGVIEMRDKALSLEEEPDEELPAPTAVALAPPNAESLSLSNAALPVLQEAINERRGFLGYSVLPYDESLPLFLARGFDFDGSGSYDEQRMLYQSLNATGVWHSSFIRSGDTLDLKAQLEDTRTHQMIDEIDVTLDSTDERSKAFTQGFHLFTLPNALTFSLSTQYFSYDRPGLSSVTLQAADNKYWWQKGLQYLSQISITNLPIYRPERGGRWTFTMIPMLKISRRDLVANGTPEIDGQTYTRWLGAVGYGPEIGYQNGHHYFYVDLDLNATWTNINWSNAGQDFSVTKTALQTSAEIGYLYSINDIFSLRIFAATFPENAEAWREALNKTSNGSTGGSTNNATVGLSLGFSYEPFLVRTFREKVRKAPLQAIPLSPYQASSIAKDTAR